MMKELVPWVFGGVSVVKRRELVEEPSICELKAGLLLDSQVTLGKSPFLS
jgi:hypothetical protein